ncbi:hypothetical protein Moror_627 [Moniliophthora roreri MCA 2997]|uniref:Uncharacterized protein n=1 Tax=Moniliophthora roreri (strain MCA 2997) TaxID=1381753 RepID=V2WX03_MONRO|nr:hypothetical protein Moror_627 [Moniliophthora roreri MCA 2997]
MFSFPKHSVIERCLLRFCGGRSKDIGDTKESNTSYPYQYKQASLLYLSASVPKSNHFEEPYNRFLDLSRHGIGHSPAPQKASI